MNLILIAAAAATMCVPVHIERETPHAFTMYTDHAGVEALCGGPVDLGDIVKQCAYNAGGSFAVGAVVMVKLDYDFNTDGAVCARKEME